MDVRVGILGCMRLKNLHEGKIIEIVQSTSTDYTDED